MEQEIRGTRKNKQRGFMQDVNAIHVQTLIKMMKPFFSNYLDTYYIILYFFAWFQLDIMQAY